MGMPVISPSVLSKVVKTITPKNERVEESQFRGTIVFSGGEHYIQLDGAPNDSLTPIANIEEGASDSGFVHGDRVLVLIKNHQAIVTKNLTTGLQAKAAKDASAFVTDITDEGITAQRIIANDTFTNTLRANDITADEIVAGMATIDSLDTTYAHITNGVIDNAKIGHADVNGLNANYAHITSGVIDNAKIDQADVNDLDANYAHITSGVIDNAKIDQADVNGLNANYAHITNGTIDNAKIGYANVKDLNAHYAEIDLANVNNAWIQNGVVKDASISDAQIIGVSANKLTAGTIDASNITVTNLNADNITAGTLNGQRIGAGSLSLDKLSEEVPTKDYVDDVAENLQGQIDGQIETWTGSVVPTLQNSPAVNWGNNSEKHKHVGDIYYVVNASNSADGYTYRFTESGTAANPTYSWTLIKDNQITKALQDIIDIQGDITGIQQFDTQISSWKTNTDSELSSLKSRTSTLETDMGTKVSTTTFNELSQTVESNKSSITSMSTVVSQKADASSVYTKTEADNTFLTDIDVSVQQTSTGANITVNGDTVSLSNGAKGDKGDKGDTGAQGPQGIQGPQGVQGETGAKGDKGDKGDAGSSITVSSITYAVSATDSQPNDSAFIYSSVPSVAEGSWLWTKTVFSDGKKAYSKAKQGAKGDKGDTGEQGPQGETGAKGDKGDTGAQGPQGIQGVKGDTGAKGDKGDTGAQGPQGVKGDTGAQGPQGIQGVKGDTGDQGVSVIASTPYYILATTKPAKPNAKSPSGWQTTEPTYDATKDCYMSIRTDFDDGTFSWSDVSKSSSYAAAKEAQQSVTILSNTVNEVEQKADSNVAKITNITTTLGTNADGTTKVNDIVHKVSAVQQDLNGFKTIVEETYATQDDVDDKADASTVYTKSEIDQTVSGINASVSAKADGQETTAALELKANKATLTSEINASADTVKINASRVQVDGNLIVGKSQMDSAIGDAVDALESDISNAAKTATDYITYINATDGIKVHNANDTSNYAQINSDGMQVVKSGVSVAEFGETSRIGKEDESHIQIDYHSIQLKDKEGNIYFHVSDLRDRDDDYKATFKEYFTGNGNRTVFKVSNKVTDTVSVVDGSDTENTATLSPIYEKALTFDPTKDYYTIIATYVDNPKERNFDTYYSRAVYSQFSDVTCYSPSSPPYDQNNDYYTVAGTLVESPTAENLSAYYTAVPRIYTFANTPADGADITITYKTDYVVAKAYTLGRRVADSGIGVYSVVEGESNIASGRGTHVEGIFNKGVGQYSHAEGMSNSVDGWYSHVEGNRNIASGYACHAEGYQTYSTGRGSHAEGEGTYAANRAQHSLGSYNDVDTLPISSPPVHPSGDRSYGHYALIIGNGTSNSNRSNAFAVDWNGDIYPQNTKMADFVVEQGTNGIWTYRKWNSGVAECWGVELKSTAISNNWNGSYYSSELGTNFPTGFFIDAPTTVSIYVSGALSVWAYNSTTFTKDTIKYYLTRPAQVTTGNNFNIRFHAIGRWK